MLLAVLPPLFAQGTADARIRYYRSRLGGRGTYPIYARLGLAYAQRARETGQARDYDAAARYLQRSLAFQHNYEALADMAAVELARHKFPEALRFAQEAADTMPGDPEAQGLLFDSHLALGDHQRAATVLETSFGRQQSFAMLTRLANLREYRGDLEGALAAEEMACSLAETEGLPGVTRAWCAVRMGALFVRLCRAEAAEAAYQRALALFPRYYLAREHLAELRAAQGRRKEAIGLYRELLRNLADPRYRLALADLYELEGQSGAASRKRRTAMKELQGLARNGSRAHLQELVVLLLEPPQAEREAVRWAERDWENRRDLHAAAGIAWAYFHSGRLREAESLLDRALAPGGAPPGALLRAARIRHSLGHHTEARTLLGRALACPLALSPSELVAAQQLRSELNGPSM
ncbi:MAG: tetratricopeptide repeat protein [Terriglobales bacterium]